MSKLLGNKQIIHIVSEIVILIGIVFYFSSKNNNLIAQIDDLSQRLEEQNELIQKHEQIIRQLVQSINNRGPVPVTLQQPSISMQTQSNNSSKTGVRKPKQVKQLKEVKIVSPKKPIARPPQVTFDDNEEVDEVEEILKPDEESSEDDSDLDAEIADELEELQQQDGLKKRL